MITQKYLCILNGDYYVKAKEVEGTFYLINEENFKLLKVPSNYIRFNFLDEGLVEVERESSLGRRLTTI